LQDLTIANHVMTQVSKAQKIDWGLLAREFIIFWRHII